MCHAAAVAPYLCYVAIIELYPGMTKRNSVDQVNHLLRSVGSAKAMISPSRDVENSD